MNVATKNSNGKLLTIKEAAEVIHETPNTIRNWMRDLRGIIPTIRLENQQHFFDNQGMERLRLIQDLNRSQGFTLKQIYYLLSNQDGISIEKMHNQEDIKYLSNQLKAIERQLDKQMSFNHDMFLKIESQQRFIESLLLRMHDRQFMQSIRASSDRKEGQLVKKGFSKLFG